MTLNNKKMANFLLMAIFLFLIDRIIKVYALYNLFDSISIFGNFLKLNLAKNYYIAFSIPLGGLFIIVLSSAIILFLVFYIYNLYKKDQITEAGLLTIVFLGAVSNIIDRIKYGFVIDYIDLKYFTVFNIADMMISLSAIALIYYYLNIKDSKIDTLKNQ